MTRRPARLLIVLTMLLLTASVVPGGAAAGATGPATFREGGPDYRWESTFAGPGLDDAVSAAVVWDDGSGPALYLAGQFLTAGDRQVNRIARWDGERWSALAGPSGTGMNGPVSALAVYDGALVAGGSFTSAGGATVNHVARWDGEAWSPLAGPDGTGVEGDRGPGVFALAVLDGELVAAGAFSHAGGTVANNVARWDGQGWASLAGGAEPGVGHAIVPPAVYTLQAHDGDLVVAGRFTHAGGAPAAGVARWDGGGWSPLGGGVGGMVVPTVRALAVYDGELVAAGQFPEADGTAVNNVARWDGQAWSPLGAGTSGTVQAVTILDGGLVAGGGFAEAGGTVVNNVARWDGQAWSPLAGSGGTGVHAAISTDVAALLPIDDGLLVGGRFDTAGGVVVNNLARWDGADWSVPAGSTSRGLSGGTANVQAAIPYQGDLVVGGGFIQAGGQVVNRIARWDGAAWSPLGSGFDSFQVRALAVYDGDLVAGGQFTEAGGVTVNRIARWDGQAWSPLAGPGGVGLDGEVIALAVYDGELVVAGNFVQAGGVTVNRIARWDGQAWSPLAGSSGAIGTDGPVRTLTTMDGELVAGGRFTEAGGVVVNNVARWDGQGWSPLPGPSGVGLSGQADALVTLDGALYAGGTFHEAGGVAVSRIARWDGEGAGWSPLSAGTDNGVLALGVLDGELVAGGVFRQAGGVPVDRIARWDGERWSALDGPAGSGANDWVNTLLTVDADGSGPAPERLVAGGHFELTGGVANWYLGVYGPAALTATPDPLDFGEVTVGETGGPLSLTLTNTGVADVTVEEVSGPLPPFAPAGGGDCGPAPFTLPAQGGACTMAFTFRPTSEGPATGSVTFVAGGGTGLDPVTLRGTGTPGAGLTCDRTITGVHIGALTVGDGVTCLAAGAQVLGEVDVLPGAGLVATAAVVQGPVSATGATVVEMRFAQVTGPMLVTGATGSVVLFGSQVTGGVSLVGNPTAEPATVAGNTVIGSLSCFGNGPAPTDHGLPNTATGGKFGQCAGL